MLEKWHSRDSFSIRFVCTRCGIAGILSISLKSDFIASSFFKLSFSLPPVCSCDALWFFAKIPLHWAVACDAFQISLVCRFSIYLKVTIVKSSTISVAACLPFGSFVQLNRIMILKSTHNLSESRFADEDNSDFTQFLSTNLMLGKYFPIVMDFGVIWPKTEIITTWSNFGKLEWKERKNAQK